jgi:hypothetical protein
VHNIYDHLLHKDLHLTNPSSLFFSFSPERKKGNKNAEFLCSDSVQISQRLMVQGYSGHEKYNGGLDVARKIIRTDGIRGFYRGFGLSVMTYSPSSAVWWASYGSSQRIIWR